MRETKPNRKAEASIFCLEIPKNRRLTRIFRENNNDEHSGTVKSLILARNSVKSKKKALNLVKLIKISELCWILQSTDEFYVKPSLQT